MCDGRTGIEQQADATVDLELPAITISVDGFAFDVLHRQPRQPVGRGAAIEKPGNVRVTQPGEELPLGTEPREQFRDGAIRLHYLDGDARLIRGVITLRKVDRAHAAAPDLPEHAVCAKPRAGGERRCRPRERVNR